MADLAGDLIALRESRRTAEHYLGEYQSLSQHWASWKRRIRDADAICRGDWEVVFPNEAKITERPRVPNIVQLALDDRSSVASSVAPSIRVDATSEAGQARAKRRQRIAYHYLTASKMETQRPRFFFDLDLCGANFKLVVPDFATGFPRIRRLNPRLCWPEAAWTPDEGLRSILVSKKVPVSSLIEDYPENAVELRRAVQPPYTTLVEVLEHYDSTEWVRVAVLGKGIVLGGPVPNRLGRCPVVVAARPTHDDEFRGLFDNVLGPQNAENRLMNLLVDAAAEWVGAPLVSFDIENIEQYGTGAIMHARSREAFVRRMPPDGANTQIYAVLERLRGGARQGAVYPEGRSGEAGQSIISAAGVNALQGNYSSSIAQDQKIEAASLVEVLSLCFQVDETYFGGMRKWIAGEEGSTAYGFSYVPEVDIKGDHRARVEYGGAAGGDQFSYEIRLTQQVGNGLLSRRTAREKLSTIDDVLEEESRITKEQILTAGLAFVQARAQEGDFSPASALLAELDKKDGNIFQVLQGFGDLLAPPAPAGGPSTGMEAFQQMSSAMRGGQAGPMNVPGVGAAPEVPPPLSQILAR